MVYELEKLIPRLEEHGNYKNRIQDAQYDIKAGLLNPHYKARIDLFVDRRVNGKEYAVAFQYNKYTDRQSEIDTKIQAGRNHTFLKKTVGYDRVFSFYVDSEKIERVR